MGWFSSSTSTSTSESTNDSAAPSRSERKACWDSRDLYFGCLDKSGVSVPGQEGDKCKQEDGTYRDKCAASWVDYFNKRRVLQLRQDMMERRAAEQQAGLAQSRTAQS
ncbi:Coa6p [Sporobolomyces salmoneus]|uniref:Coa6p n=1 Tax=Sporobolomyces salmoneus TaxID=183962 RepID=UPI00317969E8